MYQNPFELYKSSKWFQRYIKNCFSRFVGNTAYLDGDIFKEEKTDRGIKLLHIIWINYESVHMIQRATWCIRFFLNCTNQASGCRDISKTVLADLSEIPLILVGTSSKRRKQTEESNSCTLSGSTMKALWLCGVHADTWKLQSAIWIIRIGRAEPENITAIYHHSTRILFCLWIFSSVGQY